MKMLSFSGAALEAVSKSTFQVETARWCPGLVVLVVICLHAFHPAQAKVIDLQDGSYTTIEEFRSRPDRVTRRTEADEKLVQRVAESLQGKPAITIDAENGTVTLKGTVKNTQERLELVRLVQSLDEVKAVRAELYVPGEYNEAEEIKKKNRQLGLDLF